MKFSPFQSITNNRTRKHLIEKFTRKIGLVYFGSVDQRNDDHRVVRGFTVSSTHRDSHFSVGTFDGYDMSLVDRKDSIFKKDGSTVSYNWLIMAIDLRTKQDVPYIFINANNHDFNAYESLFLSNPSLGMVPLGTFENYDDEFTSRFNIYSQPSDAIEIERLLPAMTTRVLGTHFWPYSAEVKDSVLYIYSDEKKITQNTLNTMLEIGIWLAKQIDSQIELV